MSSRLALIAPFALVALAACADDRQPLQAAGPTAPVASVEPAAVGGNSAKSSVCRSLARDRALKHARLTELKAQKAGAELTVKEIKELDTDAATLAAMAEEACH